MAKRLVLWFVISGAVGILTAIALAVLASYLSVDSEILFWLWPPSSVGFLIDPSSTSAKIIVGIVELGGNFMLYGIAGFLVGMVAERFSGRL